MFGHPRGLYVLFFTEMWERFSYYGMRALLVLYMVNYFKWAPADSSRVYKWYTALVYLTPIVGGFLADRYLGNKRAVIIGSSLMAIGHFLMAWDAVPIFYCALAFLILGNGMFKANMSTQVGRLYPENDPRRDGAYTIFYMGINLGAFLSPLVCGRLAEEYGYHYGFGAAGVGMLLGLVTYLVGLPWIREISGVVPKVGSAQAPEATESPSALPRFSRVAPSLVLGIGAILLPLAAMLYATKLLSLDNVVGIVLTSVVFLVGGTILRNVSGAARDRVLAIYAIGFFVVFFWAAFEQAGNAMNLWADKYTDRTLFGKTTVDAASFQSINPFVLIFLAPVLAWLWTWLEKRKLNPSSPRKMAMGILIQGLAFTVMTVAARSEDGPSSTKLGALPPSITLKDQVVHFRDAPDLSVEAEATFGAGPLVVAQAGRLSYVGGALEMNGVLPDIERDRILRATAKESYARKLVELAMKSVAARDDRFTVSVVLDEVPPGFDLKYAEISGQNLGFDATTRTLSVTDLRVQDKDYKAMLVAGADPVFRDALNELYLQSSKFRVGSGWLFWFYVLSTIGELCLQPIGLSMTNKLAPAKYSTMLMGLWYLTIFFGNFVAGALGESWGTITPTLYFLALVAATCAASVLLFAGAKRIVVLMHGVR